MTKEQAIEILKCFKDNEIQRDTLEIDNRCGGWKIGRIYKSLELNTAIETVLSMLKEKDNIIASKDRLLSVLTIEQNENEKELEMLKDFKEIAESKVTELNPIRISKNESVIK